MKNANLSALLRRAYKTLEKGRSASLRSLEKLADELYAAFEEHPELDQLGWELSHVCTSVDRLIEKIEAKN